MINSPLEKSFIAQQRGRGGAFTFVEFEVFGTHTANAGGFVTVEYIKSLICVVIEFFGGVFVVVIH